jgi:hypothetical protein
LISSQSETNQKKLRKDYQVNIFINIENSPHLQFESTSIETFLTRSQVNTTANCGGTGEKKPSKENSSELKSSVNNSNCLSHASDHQQQHAW